MDEQTVQRLQENFSLLCEIIREPAKEQKLKADLSRIETIIQEEIPEALKKNAPEDFYVLYSDFKDEYDRFRDFILYDKLIGKNVVALGGGFSSGKSSFLNALMGGRKILPENIDPSTAVPTYIVHGEQHEAHGLNVFNAQVTLNLRRGDLRKIAHGFGETEDEEGHTITSSITLGHILKSVFFSTPLQAYKHIAFLDTPGYSKPDTEGYSVKTDEQIARGQLNTSNFILWFVPLEKNGTISQSDIDFIRTLREDIPKMIILSQSDKKDISNLRRIITRTKADLDSRKIRCTAVHAFSSRPEQISERELLRFIDSEKGEIFSQLDAWNRVRHHTNYALNFKTLFARCNAYYEDRISEESRKLSRLNISMTALIGDEETMEPLERMASVYKSEITSLRKILETLNRLQTSFFAELKSVSDQVGLAMQDPVEVKKIKIDTPRRREIVDEILLEADPSAICTIKNIRWANRFISEILSQRNDYLIKNPQLQDSSDYLRNGYYRMLALIPLAQGREMSDVQRALFSCMMAGTGLRFMPELIHQAQSIELKEYTQYMDRLRETQLRFRFAFDAILMSCCGGQNERGSAMAGALLESLRIDRNTKEYLCALAKSVLEQDSDALWAARSMKKRGGCEDSLFDGFIRHYIKDKVIVSDTLIDIFLMERKGIDKISGQDLQQLKSLTCSASTARRTAVFENVIFPGNGWQFKDYDLIRFKNCVFHWSGPYNVHTFNKEHFKPWDSWERCVSFMNVNRIQFEGCHFNNCNGIAVSEKNVHEAAFERCHFENCWLLHTGRLHHDWPPPPDWTPLGALIHNDGTCGINTISNSEFFHCGGVCTRYYHVSAILSDCNCVVRDSRFHNCHHFRNTSSLDPKKTGKETHKKLTLFLPGTSGSGNIRTDSVNFS